MLERRVERLADLADQEGHDEDHQCRQGQSARQGEGAARRALGDDAHQRLEGEHGEPDAARRSRFGIGEADGGEGQEAPRPAEEVGGGEGGDENDEQVEQGPVANPGRARLVDAAGVQQPPTGRQLQRRGDRLEVVRPAHRRKIAAGAVEAAVGVEVDGAGADLDAGRRVGGEAGDELVAAVDGNAPEQRRRCHVEPPGARQLAADAVAHGVAAAVEVEPQRARQGELIGGGADVAAAALDQAQFAVLAQQIGGELAPVRGQIGLLWVDRLGAFDGHQAQVGMGAEDPHLARRPPLARRGQCQFPRRPLVAGQQLQRPAPGARLQAQAPVGFEARRQRAGERHRHEAGGQHRAEQQFAADARYLELDVGLELQGDIVVNQAVDDGGDAVTLVGHRRAPLQPQASIGVAVGERHRLAAQGERQQPGGRGDGQQLR